MLNSLRSRLMFSYFLVTLICLLVISVLLLILVLPLQGRLVYAQLLDQAVPTMLWVRELSRRGITPDEIVSRFQEQGEQQQPRLFLVNGEGLVLAESGGQVIGQHIDSFVKPGPATPRWPVRDRWTSPSGERYFYISVPALPNLNFRALQRPLSPDAVVVVLAAPQRFRALLEIVPFTILSVAAGLGVSVLAALAIARWISWPLQRVTQAAEEIALGNYDQSLNISSPDEVRRLANSFNQMAYQVKASQQAQRDFVANVSHDLKTPLTSIRGFAQAILDGTVRDAAGHQQAAQIIKDEAERMARLVEELLALAKVAADRGRSTWVPVDVPALLQACVQRLAVQANQKQVSFKVQTQAVPAVRADPDRLSQVFTNLLDNAVKHSPAGGEILVTAQAVSESPARHGQATRSFAQVTVTDSGPGIPPEDLSRIFERFYQVDKSRAAGQGGAGLGLAIAKEIVEAHDGSIIAQSQLGEGAKFTVLLPITTKRRSK